VCVRYSSLVSNARRVRRGGQAPGVSLTLEEFAAWFSGVERCCEFCRIDEAHLGLLGLKTQVGLALARLGVDRIDSSRGYEVDNISLCCFACNKVKSNTFTQDEMRALGVGVAAIWQARLAAIGLACVRDASDVTSSERDGTQSA
jgi:hypothetical protein